VRAFLGDRTVLSATAHLPAWGAWWADVEISAERDVPVLSGAVELTINDITLSGTVVTGGTWRGRERYRIGAGAASWGRQLPAKGYQAANGVQLRTVLEHLALETGETFDLDTVSGTLGPHWTRQAGPAGRTLHQIAPQAWHVGLDGVTRLGSWPASTYDGQATRTDPADPAGQWKELAAITLSGLVPGATVDGLVAVDIVHRIRDEALRTRVWGSQGASSRLTAALQQLVDTFAARLGLRGVWSYRVISQNGETLDLQPEFTSLGLPVLQRVPVRLPPGIKAEHTLGSLVLVAFANGDPARPAVIAGDDPSSPGWLPQTLMLDADGDVLAADGAFAVLLNGQGGLTISGVQPGPGVTGAQISIGAPPLPSPLAPSRLKA
jgi:hypothetical protein